VYIALPSCWDEREEGERRRGARRGTVFRPMESKIRIGLSGLPEKNALLFKGEASGSCSGSHELSWFIEITGLLGLSLFGRHLVEMQRALPFALSMFSTNLWRTE
jgi:hypothetical protein